MKQDDLKDLNETWRLAAGFAARHQRLFKLFKEFSSGAGTLEKEGEFSGNIQVVTYVNSFDVTFASRTFRFRFTSRATQAGHTGHICMTEIDPLTNKELPKPVDIAFCGDGKLMGLTDPSRPGQPITLNKDVARSLVVLALYNAVSKPA